MSLMNGAPPETAAASRYGRAEFRAEQRRLDEDARHRRNLEEQREAAARRRENEDARHRRRQEEREQKQKARRQRRKERQQARRQRWRAARGAITEHMPLPGLPVVVVSLVMGWGGQVGAAVALGMGVFAFGIPVLTEGMTLTLAGLTAVAIHQRRPHGRLLAYTWISGMVAAAFNAGGHLIEDSSPAGMYRAGAYAIASLAALILWAVVMRAKRTEISKVKAEEVARWRRLRRRHPLLARRARRLADVTGQDIHQAWVSVWLRTHGAPPGEPTIAEIRAERRARFRRTQAEGWDGRRRWPWTREELVPAEPVTAPSPADEAAVDEEPETVPAVTAAAPETVPASERQGGLWVPGPPSGWGSHTVPLPAATTLLGSDPETATPRFPQGLETVPAGAGRTPEPDPTPGRETAGDGSAEPGPNGDGDTADPATERVREAVTDNRLETVREMVTAVAETGGDLTRKPSVRETRKRLGCRSGTAKELLKTALAERGVTRTW